MFTGKTISEFQIVRERPDPSDAQTLIRELEALLSPLYPDESRQGYSVEKLIAEGVALLIFLVDNGV